MTSLRSFFSFSSILSDKRTYASAKDKTTSNPILSSNSLNSYTFSCILADESREKSVELVSATPTVADLYEKIAAAFGIEQEEIHFCTLNTPQRNLLHVLKSQIRSNDVIFVHLRGSTHYIYVMKDKSKLGLFLTDDERGNVFVISLQRKLQILPLKIDVQITNHYNGLDIVDANENATVTNHMESKSTTKTIEVGDQILFVNGECCTGKSHNFVSSLIRNAPLKEKISIVLRKPKDVFFGQDELRMEQTNGNGTLTLSRPISSSVNQLDYASSSKPDSSKRELPSTSSHGNMQNKSVPPINVIDDYLLHHLGIQDATLRSKIHSLGLQNLNTFKNFSYAIQSELEACSLQPSHLLTLWQLFLPPPSTSETTASSTIPGSVSISSSYQPSHGNSKSHHFDASYHKSPNYSSSSLIASSNIPVPRLNQRKAPNVSGQSSPQNHNQPLQLANLPPLPHKKHRQTASLGSMNFILTKSTDEANVTAAIHHKSPQAISSSNALPLSHISENRIKSTSHLSDSTSSYCNPSSKLSDSSIKLSNKLSFINVPQIKSHLEARSRSHPSLVSQEMEDNDLALNSPSSNSREQEYAATLASMSNRMFNKASINGMSNIPLQQKLKPSRQNMALPPLPSSPGRNNFSSVINKDSRSLSHLSLMNESVSIRPPSERTDSFTEKQNAMNAMALMDPPVQYTKQRQNANDADFEYYCMVRSTEFINIMTKPSDEDKLVLKCRVSTEV